MGDHRLCGVIPCGSGLARDGIDAVCQIHRIVAHREQARSHRVYQRLIGSLAINGLLQRLDTAFFGGIELQLHLLDIQ